MPPRRTLATVVVALAAVACGDDEPTDAEQRAALVGQLAEDLVTASDGALDGDAARCVAERLADDVGVERFDEVVAAARDGGDDALGEQAIDAFAACDALDPLAGAG